MFHLTRVVTWAAAGFKAEGAVLIRPSQTGVVSTKVTPFLCDRLRGEERDVCNSRAEDAGEVRPRGHGAQLGWAGQARAGKATDLWLGEGHGALSDIASPFLQITNFAINFTDARRQTPWILRAAQFWNAVRVD
jgi:hypothetical protein